MTSKATRAIFIVIVVATVISSSFARDLKLTIPKRSKPTPVQDLNREGVKAVQKHQLEKAEKIFYKAYLLDPDDPFTLNNLGYISELQGKVERAQQYYQLAAKENTETVVEASSVKSMEGHPLNEVTGAYGSRDMRVNRGNVDAMGLLNQGRILEAEAVLRRALVVDPHSPFTLNNLGYTMEAEGELESALGFYTQAAAQHSAETIVVAADQRWRGKPISETAAANAKALQKRMASEQTVQARVGRLNLQGVSALNHNDPDKAKSLFEQAYQIDPRNAFALNNMGYVAEMNRDQETANEYYSAAKTGEGANQKAALVNHSEMNGMKLGQVADSNDQATQANLEAQRLARSRQGGPIQLRRRDNSLVTEPETSNAPVAAPVQTAPVPQGSTSRPPVDNAPVDNAPVPPYVPRPPQ
ncbi:MAG: tetratricopeptide repeat protein [Acidobacteriaceae bacterium]